MSFVDDSSTSSFVEGEWQSATDRLRSRTDALGISATQFAGAMTKAFSQASAGGKQFDDVLKSLALRLSNLALQSALKPLFKDLGKGLENIFNGGIAGTGNGTISAFASGGVIGAPTYFPLASGGLGLAGEAGPEAIVPLARGADGRLGISSAGASAAPNITVQIATPDAASFRRSEAYVTGQIARAVARGQRGL
jgi:phage-related minor tail protein